MADKLTAQQHQAVHDRGGKLLVSAAAGSGKTKVLVDRLMTYLMDASDPANLDDFLIITYTKAAASELRGKIAAKLSEFIARDPENLHLQKQMQRLYLTKISTVHGFCSDLLQEYAFKLDISSDFRVADENECNEIRETVMKDLLEKVYQTDMLDENLRIFLDTQGLGRDDRLIPQIVLKVYDSSRCHKDPGAWLENCIAGANPAGIADASETVWGQYLIADLHQYLDRQISVMEKCVKLAEGCEGFSKVTANLWETIHQLRALRGSDTWDEIAGRRLDYGRLSFPRKNVDSEIVERIKAARNGCKKGMERKLLTFVDPSAQVLQDLNQCAGGIRGMVALVQTFDQAYAQAKNARRVLDFGDLEHKTLDLLLGKHRSHITSAAREIGRRFREIMVDEYQDSNGIQDAIFAALTKERQNCFMVGDVKQSIYQFRLADPGIFLEKYQDYLPADQACPGQGRKVFLSHNFRSGMEIISAVNSVFAQCMSPQVGGLRYGEEEALREGLVHEALPEPAVELHCLDVQEDTYYEEATFVAQKIQSMLNDGTLIRTKEGLRPVQAEDIVILLRSPGSVGSHFQNALEKLGIRCSSGGGMDLLQTEEVATIRSFLRIIVNPRQDIPLISTLASPIFGFTADDLAYIRGSNHKGCFYDALMESEHPKANAFLEILGYLRREVRMNSLTGLLEQCYSMTRLDSIYASMEGGEARLANLQAFYQLAIAYEKGSLRDLNQFLEHLEALEGRGLLASGSSAVGCVTIMSIHKSKGLEFPVVFLCGLSRVFNRESLQAQILCDKDLGIGLSVVDTVQRIRYPSLSKRAIMTKTAKDSISEELRVLYVAMTRARDRLIMTYSVKNLQKDLQDIVLRMDFDSGLLCQEVICPGEWILLSALRRSEAGALHLLGARPSETAVSDQPWKICAVHAPEDQSRADQPVPNENRMPENVFQQLADAIAFRYPYAPSTKAPSKVTATDRKGRTKDDEAVENTRHPVCQNRSWRAPSFLSNAVNGKAYGNLIHSAMQYVRYENCGTVTAVKREILRLADEGYITQEQSTMIDGEQIAAFFASEIGRKLVSGYPHLREFKFSLLDDGENYGHGLNGEKVLLQGVVDCALLEEDGITVVDFKTDCVTEETVNLISEKYISQVQTYCQALSRIYDMPVKAGYLYFFRLNRFVRL